ncbi:MAG: DUF2953 domain-containing protein [Ruminococcaceae bacterium]|nr:DUF2953 domain-containing protein [Oscillospiraceae bacterium]
MLFLWILLGILALLFLISMLSAHVILEYREDVTLTLAFLFLKFRLFPAKQKKARLTKRTKKTEKQKQVQKKQDTPEKPSGEEKGILEKLKDIRTLLTVLLKRTLGHLSIRTARIHIFVATGDAASTAILYGAVNGGVALLLETLDRFGKLKYGRNDEILVCPDYLGDKTRADLRISFSLRVWHILDILLKTLLAYTKTRKQKVKS